jgi:hypothetical protein
MVKSRKMSAAGHVECMEAKSTTCNVLVRKLGRTPLGRPRRRWKANIKIDLKEGG